jgi:hypothetical protein
VPLLMLCDQGVRVLEISYTKCAVKLRATRIARFSSTLTP